VENRGKFIESAHAFSEDEGDKMLEKEGEVEDA
jgi:hypothetical protein